MCSEEPLCHVGCGDIDECDANGGLNDCQNIATAGGFADSFTCSNTIGFVLKIHEIFLLDFSPSQSRGVLKTRQKEAIHVTEAQELLSQPSVNGPKMVKVVMD